MKVDDFSQRYGQIEVAFWSLTKDHILQPCLSDHGLISSITADGWNEIGSNLLCSDIQYQKRSTGAQTMKVEMKFSEDSPADVNGYALVLTNGLISLKSDGRKHFNLIGVATVWGVPRTIGLLRNP